MATYRGPGNYLHPLKPFTISYGESSYQNKRKQQPAFSPHQSTVSTSGGQPKPRI